MKKMNDADDRLLRHIVAHPTGVSRDALFGVVGSVDRHLVRLRKFGLIDYPSPGRVIATTTGRGVLKRSTEQGGL